MLGFLFKIIIVAAVVIGVGFLFIKYRQGSGVNLNFGSVMSSVKSVDFASLSGQLSQGLDSLVTRSSKSPVVLGIQITNDSLKTVADTLQGLPPDQLKQIKQYLCQPTASSSGQK